MFAKAPACTVGELAQAVLADGSVIPSLKEASRVDKSHSERNAHRLFFRYGLALKIPISSLRVDGADGADPLDIPYLKMTDFLQYLLKHAEEVLFGGKKMGEETSDLCSTFWQRFRGANPDHVVYSELSEEERSMCVPLFVHGDKGRTLQKSPIFVLSFETPWGMPAKMLERCAYDNKCASKKQFRDGKLTWPCARRVLGQKRKYDDLSSCTLECPEGAHQRHNAKGHSFLSRFLISAVTSKVYNRNEQVLPSLLMEAATELRMLFEDGLEHSGTGCRVRFAFIGAKGDAEWHFEAGNFSRSYHHTGTVNEQKICPLCDAGAPGVSFTDCRDEPAWAATIAATDPWEATPPLNFAPYASRFAASMYKFDPFHVLKFGVFRDCIASTVVRLSCMTYFDFAEDDKVSIVRRLERAYSMYKPYCLATNKNPTLKKFTKSNFNFEKYSSFAWVNCKGSEATQLMCWLDFQLGEILKHPLKQEEDRIPLMAMKQTISGGLTYVGIMHSHGVFLPRSCAQVQLDAGLSFLRGYAYLADYCTRMGVTGFRLRPKLHYLHHLLYETQQQLQSGSEFVLSSSTYLCEQNEDFIGRISRVSRRVAARTAGMRTTQRYLVKVRCLLKRLLPE